MAEFRIEAMASRKLDSDMVVYYVKDSSTNKLLTKYDSNTLNAEDITGWTDFTPTQKLELKQAVSNMRFTIDKLGLPAKYNRAYRIALPIQLQDAMNELYSASEKCGINFDPTSAMLNGVLNHIKTTEKRLAALQNQSILESHGITLLNKGKGKEEEVKDNKRFIKKIFKQFLKISNGLEKYADIAKELYSKDTNLNSTAIVRYSEGKAKPSQWSVSCAIYVLWKEGVDLSEFIPISTLIALWLVPLKFMGIVKTESDAMTCFNKTLLSTKIDNKEYKQIIANIIKTSL